MAENIKVIIRERRAQVDGGPVIVCGNSDYTITFDFDSDWNLTGPKTARFVYVKGGEVLHEDKVFSGKTVAVPVLSDVSFVDVGVFAGDLCTTTPARIRCKRSILCGSGEVHEPTPDVYAQIMALFNEMAEQGAFGATEAQAQQIEANKQNIAKLTNGTTPAGKATDADKLGGETALQWQGKIDSIQTTSRATLSQAGWYRVAEYIGGSEVNAKGETANSCFLSIKRRANILGTESYYLRVTSMFNNQKIHAIDCSVQSIQLITKVRYVYTGNIAYLEIYYAGSGSGNGTFFEVTNPSDRSYTWKAITPTLTEETVDGVTVTTTYDIPANASPVTDLDLERFRGAYLTTSILEKALEVGYGYHNFRLGGSKYTGDDLPTKVHPYGMASILYNSTTDITVLLYGSANSSSDFPIAYNHYSNAGWKGWKSITTTEDLANYFKNTGGEINGNVTVYGANDTVRQIGLQNGLRRVYQNISREGEYQLFDGTNNKSIIRSSPGGATNTFNGTASGNIAKEGTGTQTVKATSAVPFAVHNNTENATQAYQRYMANNAILGVLGFAGVDIPVFTTSSGSSKELLHTGNSAKVAIQSTAPTDGLWVW